MINGRWLKGPELHKSNTYRVSLFGHSMVALGHGQAILGGYRHISVVMGNNDIFENDV